MKIGYLKPGILLLVLLFSFRQDLFAKKRITSLKCGDKERLISGIPANRSRMSNWFLTPGVRCVLTPDTGGG